MLASARDAFLAGALSARKRTSVREPILASWVRSQLSKVPVSHPVAPHFNTEPPEGLLTRCSRAVLRQMAEELSGESVSILLTDAQGLVLDRISPCETLLRKLDRVNLAPGFSYKESHVGTNGIGTALESGRSILVTGQEHYAEELTQFACAGVPVHHPTTNVTLGVLDLTLPSGDSNGYLLALGRQGALRIQEQIRESASGAEKALMEDYLSACRQANCVIAVGEQFLMVSPGARNQFDGADQSVIMQHAADVSGRVSRTVLAELPSGQAARLEFRPTTSGGRPCGGVIRIQPLQSPGSVPSAPRTSDRAPALRGVAGNSLAWRRVIETVTSSRRRNEWIIVEGERGSGRTTLLEGIQQSQQPGHRLDIVNGDDDPDHILERAASAIECGTALTIHNAHLLGTDTTAGLVDTFMPGHLSSSTRPWVTLTVVPAAINEDLKATLLPFFPHTTTVPPLRHHMDDLPQIAEQILKRLGSEVTLSSEALNQLMRLPWPGNIEQLRRTLVQLTHHRRTGEVGVHDLPPDCRAATRRKLTRMEWLERDAIVKALGEHRGNKSEAAEALGMSRATIYRKVKDYGIS